MIKEIKYNGFTETPSDYECPDGDLATVTGLVPEDEALHPVQPPVNLFQLPVGYTVCFVHANAAGDKHYIIRYNNKLYWIDSPEQGTILTVNDFIDSGNDANLLYDFTYGINNINATGNVIEVLSLDGIHYLIWKVDKYIHLDPLKPINVRPQVTSVIRGTDYDEYYNYVNVDGYISDEFYAKPLTESDHREKLSKIPEYEEFCDLLFSEINKLELKHKQKGRFCYPFLVRFAYRAFDDYVCITQPILITPNASGRPRIIIYKNTGASPGKDMSVFINGSSVSFEITIPDLTPWFDIISSLDIFVSPQAQGYSEDNSSIKYLLAGGYQEDINECNLMFDDTTELGIVIDVKLLQYLTA